MKAYVFPGQGAQYVGMAKELYESDPKAKELLEEANTILGFRITEEMFHGTDEGLKQTQITQPAVFLHSVVLAQTLSEFKPDMVAGHSLGEFSALVANGALSFSDALQLVSLRAKAMQKACEINPGTMAAIIGLDDDMVEKICGEILDEVVVPANYNCPGQLVISGSLKAVERACERLSSAGAKRALILPVGGAFHSPLMEPARDELERAIREVEFKQPVCPVYQNVATKAIMDPSLIRTNLIAQLTSSVKWTQSVQNMILDGATEFIELGPGRALQGMILKIDRSVSIAGLSR